MPELPEVETVRRGLVPVLDGARILSVELRRANLRFALPKRFSARLSGAFIQPLQRRGKYLIAPLSTKESLIAHLGMTGRFTVTLDGKTIPGNFHHEHEPNVAHDHVIIDVDGPMGRATVIYNDPRRFGFMDLVSSDTIESCRHFAKMGPEPLGNQFTEEDFNISIAGKSAPIKTALLDQSVVAGIGNIYACEALFRAGISPRRKASSVKGKRGVKLLHDVRDVLSEAIEAGGSTLKDFAHSDGALGYFQHQFSVYDREGEACIVCSNAIKRIVQSGRSTFFCSSCQR